MSESVNLEWIGTHIRALQADNRLLQADMRSLNQRLDQIQRNAVTRADLLDGINLLVQRVATSEALLETRLDQISAAISTLKE